MLSRTRVDDAIDALNIPLLWLAPMEDGVFNEKQYHKVEKRNPNIRIEAVPNAGELIFYQKSELVIERIIQAVSER
jgi:pimeloyl-ACP methyl ester carboxylesterase